MKWFKHFSNAHKGSVLQALYHEFGVNEGHGLYFRLIEYITDKWDGSGEPRFTFLTSELRAHTKLTTRRLHQLAVIMSSSGENSFKVSEDFCHIFLPKLLEIRHRDALNAGVRPASLQHKSGLEQKKRKKKNIQEPPAWQKIEFRRLAGKYQSEFPGTTEGPKAFTRFCEQFKTPESIANLDLSLTHYRQTLDANTWRHAKTSFETYLGTKKSGLFWQSFIKPPILETDPATGGWAVRDGLRAVPGEPTSGGWKERDGL